MLGSARSEPGGTGGFGARFWNTVVCVLIRLPHDLVWQ
jgi:hypothetical protein